MAYLMRWHIRFGSGIQPVDLPWHYMRAGDDDGVDNPLIVFRERELAEAFMVMELMDLEIVEASVDESEMTVNIGHVEPEPFIWGEDIWCFGPDGVIEEKGGDRT